MVQIARVLLLLSSVSLGLALLTKRDVLTVENDLDTIKADVMTLDNKIATYPDNGGTLIQALAIHDAATALTTKVNSATTDVTATANFNGTDGRTVLNLATTLEPLISKSLIDIVTKKKAFAQLPIGGIIALICNDLKLLNTANSAFCGALLKKFPADLVQEATNLKNKLANDFIPAIAAYCNA